ncbi:putative DNA-directed RNA polymerase II subunit RPB9 [Podospora conica]|nr:putative DNA-directed RNA polymerase II subunit RPB9 [Schizothecium conicum]
MSSSPAPSESGSVAGLSKSSKKLEPIPFKFCPECSNMLYPKEDRARLKLMWVCRTCQYSEDATSTCVYRNIINNAAGETAGVTQDVTSDPTLPRSDVPCPVCEHPKCVSFQSQQRNATTGMKLFYVCGSCSNIFQLPDRPREQVEDK